MRACRIFNYAWNEDERVFEPCWANVLFDDSKQNHHFPSHRHRDIINSVLFDGKC